MFLKKSSKYIRRPGFSLDNTKHCCFIIPEYVNKRIVERGTKMQKERAWKNLVLTEQLRGRRLVTGMMSSMFSVSNKLDRTIFDAQNLENLPGKLVRHEGGRPVRDKTIIEAYNYSGDTYNFFKNIFRRNSIDTRGMKLDSTVHYGEDYNNAFWNGTQMVYGDGDGEIFQRFTKSVDVIGHELSHGVTQYEAALQYEGQSGALNESFSDVFGSLVKQYALGQKAERADWLIGNGLFSKKVNGIALRSMKAPGTAYDDSTIGKDPQPGHMKNYVNTTSDNGGVHINSGIPNRAFYLTAIELGGYAWKEAGKIWYVTLTEKLNERSDFQDLANKTMEVSTHIYGKGSKEQKAVLKSWKLVGINVKAHK
ncbi:MAG TPA: M4 family metallopeptidase [Nitrososphaeraceae archaeon]|nr:M4 family metallopeptidase [Nitrososphaeraceae archaeon]